MHEAADAVFPVVSPEDAHGQLRDLAASALSTHRRRFDVADRLRLPQQTLLTTYRRLAADPRSAETSSAAEWLLDNYYVIERALRLAPEQLPLEFAERLPRLASGALRHQPAAYAMAGAILDLVQHHIDIDALILAVDEIQTIRPLCVAELWALPALLRVALLERLALAATAIGRAADGPNHAAEPCVASLDRLVSSCIYSLRALDAADWKAFFERVSVIERILRNDPAGAYSRMDFDTRDRYRKAVEEVAAASRESEAAVATTAVQLASKAGAGRAAHVGYYLVDAGFDRLADAVGYDPKRRARWQRWLKRRPALIYLGGIVAVAAAHEVALCAALLQLGAGGVLTVLAALLALVPAITVAVSVVNATLTRALSPAALPKMDFSGGVPAEWRTLIVVPVILTQREEVDALLERLEIHWLANADSSLQLALLTDFADAPCEAMPDDDDLLQRTRAGIEVLNGRHGGEDGPFHLLHRARKWNAGEGCWMGWERKRGKLTELNRLLRGDEATGFTVHVGNPQVLRSIRFVITLDADTQLPRTTVQRLVATLAHPLNRAQFDETSGCVTAGYTILQPRVDVAPQRAHRFRFVRLFAGGGDLDLYARVISDVYQDLFGDGIYVGKGIYDPEAFERSLHGRVPDNAILSHDLFEGLHGRVGLVSDIVLLEEFPSDYLAYAKRLHRWVRGDWQLLPWLGRRVPLDAGGRARNRLAAVARWKIIDNLRRTLLAPALVVFLVVAWLWFPGAAGIWTVLAVLVLAAPAFTEAMGGLLMTAGWHGLTPVLIGVASNLQSAAGLWFLHVVLLPHRAAIVADAIGRTLVRMLISRRHLLQWVPAEHSARPRDETTRRQTWSRMAAGPVVAIVIGVLLVGTDSASLRVALPILLLWLVSPEIAFRASRPTSRRAQPLPEEDRRRLRRLARRTWLFFETFAGPDDQWLPPDHFQEDPRGEVAHRTSPTNIGMLQLATVAAYDLGYLGVLPLALRLRNTMETLRRMERHSGHFYNWYDTRNLDPLEPRYVSTVDSGNLAACLLAVKQTCIELQNAPIVSAAQWQGLFDTLGVLDEVIRHGEHEYGPLRFAALRTCVNAMEQQALRARDDPPASWAAQLDEILTRGCPEFDRGLLHFVESDIEEVDANLLTDLRVWSGNVHRHIEGMRREMETGLPWHLHLPARPVLLASADVGSAWSALLACLPDNPTVRELCGVGEASARHFADLEARLAIMSGDAGARARSWVSDLANGVNRSSEIARGLVETLTQLAENAGTLVAEMDFSGLYDPQRRLFHIGYNISANAVDEHHYDLLASEARLASFVAIAKGDVPIEHWLHLGRPMGRVAAGNVLLSWSATMFEYLLPPLLLQEPADTVVGQSCLAAVREQIAYAGRRQVPWGISESSYYLFDAHQNYQYRAFGIPNLGFKRGLDYDLVVAPYASVLAVKFAPQALLKNLDDLEGLGLMGRYGLYESVDFTVARLPAGRRHALVRSFMAHHQGMVLCALSNLFNEDSLVRRFHTEPIVRTAEPLLFERPPSRVVVERTRPQPVAPTKPIPHRPPMEPWRVPLDAPFPHAHILSNGAYHLLTTDGGSSAAWKAVTLTRRRPDTTLDACGTQVYLRDVDSNAAWKVGAAGQDRHMIFHPHLVDHGSRSHGIAVQERVAVAPDDDVEIHLLTLTNEEPAARRLQLTTYGEIVLGDAQEDLRHPAFSNLFVESEYVAELGALAFRRRPLDAGAAPVWLVHTLVLPQGRARPVGHETVRDVFCGRARGDRLPAAVENGARPGTATTGATLDPIMSLSAELQIAAHQAVSLAYLVIAAESRDAALQLARRHRSVADLEWLLELARRRSEVELENLELPPARLPALETLLSLLLHPYHGLRAAPADLAHNRGAQSALWQHGISGDLPILLLVVNDSEDFTLLPTLLRGHRFWHNRGIHIDFAILNEQPAGYEEKVDARIMRAVVQTGSEAFLNRRGGVFPVHAERMTATDRGTLLAASHAVLRSDAGDLETQLAHVSSFEPAHLPPLEPTRNEPIATQPLARPTELLFDNGCGGFSAGGREYVIHLEPGDATPAPWVNVVANPRFGFVVSESGGGHTWAENSGENRLTPWRNDPVADMPGDIVYLRDEETGIVWSPTPLPAADAAPYQCRHGAGFTTFRHASQGLDQELRLYTPWEDPVKIVRLRLTNRLDRVRRITATYYVEWVLGATREQSQMFIVPEFDTHSEAMLVRNTWDSDFAGRIAFVAASKKLHGLTGDRTEFLGRRGSYAQPAGLQRIGLASAVAPGLDPCAALQVHVDLPPGSTAELHFLLGQGADRDAALDLVHTYREPAAIETAWVDLQKRWDEVLGAITIRTPEPTLDLMTNRWLLYQTLSSRVWGRTGYYQSGGAFGFRDQLQDVVALLPVWPALCRAHLLEAARHQFEEGDVLHWWHPPSGAGVRTRCADDLLWLPFVTAHYVTTTGDYGILEEKIPFLAGDPLAAGQTESYARFAPGSRSGTLYEHCCAALARGHTKGSHGLPLFGSCDWNDGMNRVGVRGRGESVWLGWFLYATLTRFAPICERHGESKRADELRRAAEKLRRDLAVSAWDGAWYRRGYYDDGSPLGSAQNQEGRIDSVAQSWAVLSSAGDLPRTQTAMESVCRLLATDDGLIRLLVPPFDGSTEDPGYISAYPAGVRENGGQYTHAAIWVVWALATLGDGDRAAALFRALLPIAHALTAADAARYRVEPYVMAADIYSVEPHRGRGGWTWYTGAAGWAHRFVLEALVGLRREPDGWRIDPCIPRSWPGFEIDLRDGATTYLIRVENPSGVNRGVDQVVLDGRTLGNNRFERLDDGRTHEVHVRLRCEGLKA